MSETLDIQLRDAQFMEYVARRRLSHVWTAQRETELARYSKIVKDLEARDRHRQEVENRVVEQRAYWAIASRNFTPQRKLACKDNINALFAIADQVQLAWAERVHGDAKFEKFLKEYAEQHNSLCKWYWIRLGDFGDEDSKETRVYKTLDHVRYYFGNSGGKYIFRHTEQEPSYYERFFPEEFWWHKHPWSKYLTNNSNDLQIAYTFCGLVPRTVQEYIARFEIVCPMVVQLLGSLLLFNDSCSKSANDELDSFEGTATSVTPTQLLKLYNGWVALEESDASFLLWAQKKARTHHLILECAYLLGSIEGQQEGFMANVMLFAGALQLAAGTHLECLADDYAKLVAEEGFNEFLEEKNLDSCILISSDIKENIHDFFKAPVFTVDPLHPSNRFRHLHAQPALDKVDALIHQEDENSNSDPLDTEGSDSSLSDLSDFDFNLNPDNPLSGEPANLPATDSSTLALYHPTDPAVPEHWDPRYPGYVGGHFHSEAGNDANHLEEEEDDGQEEEESEQLNTNNKRCRAQPTYSVKRARTYSSGSYRP
ncbi:uncharacterized protein CPUR_01885 [Claviceps purpurea 20.1]|uniref:Uncharacterized protein n=1 Tax=Claviceps purpurea (strain 20.1) TaxID=1111077 RepID=M1W3D6_CLAP2|nr:uncharacterized protein CPUR_01885 [Claviceps purpurea 20.1]